MLLIAKLASEVTLLETHPESGLDKLNGSLVICMSNAAIHSFACVSQQWVETWNAEIEK
jgi:hypothetical protein